MNILKNIVLFLCSLVVALCAAEFIAGRINIEGLSGYKMYMAMAFDKIYLAPEPDESIPGKVYGFYSGNCYPSDPAGSFPYKIVNPADHKYWYCVTYDRTKRTDGFNPERKRRMAIVGDSFTFGTGLRETDTLGYLLNEKYPEINFQNLGKVGANTDDVAKRCREITASAPKVEEVIYFYNLNDVRMSRQVDLKQWKIIDFQNIRWQNDIAMSGPVMKLLSKSALFSLMRKIWVLRRESALTVQNYKDMYLSEENRGEFISTMDEMKSIKDMLARQGISFRVVIYPLLYKDLLGRYPFEDIHARILSACRERKIECLDGYAPFASYYSMKKFAVHPIDYHPNGLCNRALLDYIRKKDFIKE